MPSCDWEAWPSNVDPTSQASFAAMNAMILKASLGAEPGINWHECKICNKTSCRRGALLRPDPRLPTESQDHIQSISPCRGFGVSTEERLL